MKIYICPKLVYGSIRGGEDLLLFFESHHDGEAPPINEEIEAFIATKDGEVEVEILEKGSDDEKYSKDARVQYTTPQYEFMWAGTASDAMLSKEPSFVPGFTATVMEHFQNPANWRFCHSLGKSPQLICNHKVWIDGNAD